MIELSLKIGNIVTVNNPEYWVILKNKPMIVCGLYKYTEQDDAVILLNHLNRNENIIIPAVSQRSEFIAPIKLTNEWLLKFGAKKDLKKELYINIQDGNDTRLYLKNGFIQLCKGAYSPIVNYKHTKYVHELQNLYYSICGCYLSLSCS